MTRAVQMLEKADGLVFDCDGTLALQYESWKLTRVTKLVSIESYYYYCYCEQEK